MPASKEDEDRKIADEDRRRAVQWCKRLDWLEIRLAAYLAKEQPHDGDINKVIQFWQTQRIKAGRQA